MTEEKEGETEGPAESRNWIMPIVVVCVMFALGTSWVLFKSSMPMKAKLCKHTGICIDGIQSFMPGGAEGFPHPDE